MSTKTRPPLHQTQPALIRNGKRGLHPHRIGQNLLNRLSTRSEDVLRFLVDPDVPFSNNEAEHEVRMPKVEQKISGGFRSTHGADIFGDTRTLIATVKKQGWNVLWALMQMPDSLIPQIRTA